MESNEEVISCTTLNGTLLNAMDQSRALFGQLDTQIRTINHLKHENEQLRQNLERLQAGRANPPTENNLSAQLEHLFRQDAEKQAEIERLKVELRAARKEGSRRRMKNSQLASPVTSSDRPEHILPFDLPCISTPTLATPMSAKRGLVPYSRRKSSPPTKRFRASGSLEKLRSVPDTIAHTEQRRLEQANPDVLARGAAAIPIGGENGEGHDRKDDVKAAVQGTAEKRHRGLHNRLDDLLSTVSAANSILARPEDRPAKSVSPQVPAQKWPALRKSSSEVCLTSEAKRPSAMRFLRPPRRRGHDFRNEEPIRSRSLERLDLSHFRLNPSYHDSISNGSAQSKELKKCLPACTRGDCRGWQIRAIAATFGPDIKISDDDLLLSFLGPGSEKKITTLTSVARENLLHEARVTRTADEYGKIHRRTYQRATSPNGFWSTDMPSLRDEEGHREQAKQLEREEVERRYQEACNEEGKWIFADE